MPTIIIQANATDGRPGSPTLIERALPVYLQSEHYVDQLVERLAWALVDAEGIEVEVQVQGASESVGSTGSTESSRPTR
jgi:hypothetical protein